MHKEGLQIHSQDPKLRKHVDFNKWKTASKEHFHNQDTWNSNAELTVKDKAHEQANCHEKDEISR